MKEELKKYLKENAKDEMWYGSDQEFWMNIIDSFFESYQPERSKREDSLVSNYNFITGNADY